MNIKKGDRLKIECYKHNGYLDRTSDEATVIHVDKDSLVVANNHTKLTEHDGKSHTTNEPAVLNSVIKRINTEKLDLIIEKSLQELIELKKAKKGAFGPNVVNEYYKNFKEIEEQEQNNDW